jgi:hypothetical protein
MLAPDGDERADRQTQRAIFIALNIDTSGSSSSAMT